MTDSGHKRFCREIVRAFNKTPLQLVRVKPAVAWAVLIAWVIFSRISWCAIPEFDGNRAYQDLVSQCNFGSRSPGSDAHRDCAGWLTESLRSLADDVEPQYFSQVLPAINPGRGVQLNAPTMDTLQLVNIIARFQLDSRERIVIGAHWDSRPMADMDPDASHRNQPIPGANDGASGVAVILQLARLFSQEPPPVGVDLVLFDGEDSGQSGDLQSWCLGSRYYAMNLRGELPRWGIVLDMIGEKNAVYSMEINSLDQTPRLVHTLWSLAENLKLYCFDPNPGTAVWDDHMMLNKYGIPSIDIIDFDYPYWHTLEDTPDKCSAESLEHVGTLLVKWIYQGAVVQP